MSEGDRRLVSTWVEDKGKGKGYVQAFIIIPNGNTIRVTYGAEYESLLRPLSECFELAEKFRKAGKIIRNEWMGQGQIDSDRYWGRIVT